MQNSKLKTLYVYQLLNKYSDENHPVSTTELIEMLAQKGITCERKSIYADVEALQEIGVDIISVKSPKRGYFIGSRTFQVPEVMLLIDAVTSAGFITPKKTNELIEKLKTLVSDNEAYSMVSQVYMDSETTKCDNEQVYYVIDKLHQAITEKNKVKVVYKRRDIDLVNKTRFKQKTHTVSPYALIWKNDHYYLVCNNDKYDNLMHLRVDRIKNLEVLDDVSRPFSEVSKYTESFDTQDYAARMYNMFSGEICNLTIECDISLQEEILDRFGNKTPLRPAENNHFVTTVEATLSDGLASWIMQYGNKIKVLEPEALSKHILQKAKDIAEIYE